MFGFGAEFWFWFVAAIAAMGWFGFAVMMDGHQDDYPVLYKIANRGLIVILILCIGVIIKYDLWC
jgi:hypothetical protein